MLCKFTFEELTSTFLYRWKVGCWQTPESGGEKDMPTDGWLHAWTDPLVAVALNPVRGRFHKGFYLWKVEVDEKHKIMNTDDGCEVCAIKMRITKKIPIPKIPAVVRLRAAQRIEKILKSPTGFVMTENLLEQHELIRKGRFMEANFNIAHILDTLMAHNKGKVSLAAILKEELKKYRAAKK